MFSSVITICMLISMIITQSVAQATGYGMVLQDYGDPNANCTLSECAIINAAQIGVSLYTGITPSGIRFTVSMMISS